MNDEMGDGAQMGIASDWVGLSLRRVLDFGGTLRKLKKMRRRVE